jgi:predicted permease
MKKRKLKHCLAVSTVVANMLMILITLSLAAILVAWAGSTYGAFTGGSQLFFLQRGQALQERLVVENVFFNASQNRILLFVRNVGLEQVNIVAIYVNGTTMTPQNAGSWLCTYQSQPPPLPSPSLLLTIGAVCEFNLNWTTQNPNLGTCAHQTGANWCTGDIFNIVIATGRGNQASYVARGI